MGRLGVLDVEFALVKFDNNNIAFEAPNYIYIYTRLKVYQPNELHPRPACSSQKCLVV